MIRGNRMVPAERKSGAQGRLITAARLNPRNSFEVQQKINVAQLLEKLSNHVVDGEKIKMSRTQVSAARAPTDGDQPNGCRNGDARHGTLSAVVEWRKKVKASQIIIRLNRHALGECS